MWGAVSIQEQKSTCRLGHLRAPFLYQLAEFVEKVARIVGSGGRLGVILHAKNRVFLVAHPFNSVVVQINM